MAFFFGATLWPRTTVFGSHRIGGKRPTIFNIRACAIVDFVVRKITIANHFGG
jgi:hypothetical protein